ncbi:MAG TPA: GvpL/GvpF family gas vesicle protein [Thermoanaerobaculia bacterium]|nr:GvpL/GvpF family gas vesicle protein [Thermoanaerobaculia bacterium]
MKFVIIGAHLRRDDVEPLATAIACGDLWLSGVGVADEQPLGDRDLLLRVAETRAKLLDRATFVAIRYGFAAAPEAAAAKCAEHATRWRRLLEANRDNVEMTLKVVAAEPKPRPDHRDFAKGAEYLRALHAGAAEADPKFRDAVSSFGEHRWIHRDGRSLECALLVPRADVERIREAGERLKRQFPEVAFLLSGPWPLEVFADHE